MNPRLEIILLWLVAAIATIGSWFHNLRFLLSGGDMVAFFQAALATSASCSIALDLWIMCFLLCWWILQEGRRVGVAYPSLYVLGGLTIAMAGAFPLFLLARRHALARNNITAASGGTMATMPRSIALSIAVGALLFVALFRIHAALNADSLSVFVASFALTDPARSWLWDLGGILVSVWLLAWSEKNGESGAWRAIPLSLLGVSASFALLISASRKFPDRH